MCFGWNTQIDPVQDEILTHINLLKYEPEHKQQVIVEVPINVMNADKSPGVKKGGLLNVVMPKVNPSPHLFSRSFDLRTPVLPARPGGVQGLRAQVEHAIQLTERACASKACHNTQHERMRRSKWCAAAWSFLAS